MDEAAKPFDGEAEAGEGVLVNSDFLDGMSVEEAKAGKFGFAVDNTIGATPQPNTWSAETGTAGWIDFYREKRIGHQLRLAKDPAMKKEWEKVLEATDGLASLFEGLEIKPSVLHGDLWSGNIAAVNVE